MISSDRVYKVIADHTSDMVCIHDSEKTIRYATPSCKLILGYEPDEIKGKKLTDFLSPEFVGEMDFATLQRFFEHPGTRIRYQIKHGEKRLRWLESTFTRLDEKTENYSLLSSTRDITESVHLTDDLMNALSSEQKFSQFKANLYSVASHEFKTPLAVIQANVEMLRIKKSEKFLEKALGTIEEEVDRLTTMVTDMLELKKLNTGKVNLKPEKLNLVKLMKEALEQACKNAFPEIKIKFEVEGEPVPVEADYSLVRYIFVNLLTNACKFSTKEKPTVDIKVSYGDSGVITRVTDYGIGIPKEDQGFVFQSFFRAGNAGNVQGTGVGLSIVKEFVDLHKGKINFESHPGKGSTFYVQLPYSIAL